MLACDVLLVYLGLISLLGALLVRTDKRRAQRARRSRQAQRIPERTLLALAAFGAWPGMLLAMMTVRHKVRKARFLALFGLAALAGTAAVAGWLVGLGCWSPL